MAKNFGKSGFGISSGHPGTNLEHPGRPITRRCLAEARAQKFAAAHRCCASKLRSDIDFVIRWVVEPPLAGVPNAYRHFDGRAGGEEVEVRNEAPCAIVG